MLRLISQADLLKSTHRSGKIKALSGNILALSALLQRTGLSCHTLSSVPARLQWLETGFAIRRPLPGQWVNASPRTREVCVRLLSGRAGSELIADEALHNYEIILTPKTREKPFQTCYTTNRNFLPGSVYVRISTHSYC